MARQINFQLQRLHVPHCSINTQSKSADTLGPTKSIKGSTLALPCMTQCQRLGRSQHTMLGMLSLKHFRTHGRFSKALHVTQLIT
jgi:hypothetical protein